MCWESHHDVFDAIALRSYYTTIFAETAAQHGLTPGALWTKPDYGHVQWDWGINTTGKVKPFWDGRFQRGQDLFVP